MNSFINVKGFSSNNMNRNLIAPISLRNSGLISNEKTHA